MSPDEEELKRYREHINKILDFSNNQNAQIYPVVIPDSKKYQYLWCKWSIERKE
jgi:hypothetical protein